MRRINEIFYSLQGEGYHTGIPAVFVRFSGCNLRCPFCDTQHEEGTLMSDEDIVMEVAKYSTQIVILTGGEPGLWIDEKLVDALHHEGKYVCIETNGTCLLPENIDWVTCSPKEGAKINLDRIRTPDTRFWRPVLYQLSYSRVCGCKGSVIFGIYKPIYEKILFIIRLIGLTH